MHHPIFIRTVCVLSVGLALGCSADKSPSHQTRDGGPLVNDPDSAVNHGDDNAVNGTGSDSGDQAACAPVSATETNCADRNDDDCDGFADCLDPDCEARACGDSDRSCLAGACLGAGALPALPRIDNLVPTVRGDTAIIDFSAVKDAQDYRIYPLPATNDILIGESGEVVVRNAVYRCGGALPRDDRRTDSIGRANISFSASVNGYTRSESEAVLGYVYLTPGAGRSPIYRVANPNLAGGFPWEYEAPPAKEYNGAEYVQGSDARDALLAQGWRDDGIAFYVSGTGTRSIYRREFADTGLSVFYADGPEKAVRDAQDGAAGEPFKVLAESADGSAPLYRIFYSFGKDHDVLAAGDTNRDRVLNQGNMPVTTLLWPGLRGETTLVIEALDSGCPWPGGYLGGKANPAVDADDFPTLLLDQARLPSGEVFVNGQYAPTNRPKPIARAYVTVQPKPHPQMDWFQSFDPDVNMAPFQTIVEDGIHTRVYRNDALSVEYSYGGNANYAYGAVLGQFIVGSSNTLDIAALNANAQIANDRYLHVTMSADINSTNRRYPQIMITDTELGDPTKMDPSKVPMIERFGPRPFEHLPAGMNHTIIVQTFGGQPELQIEFCDLRGWGVSQQCGRANVYGFHAGLEDAEWTQPWLPNPVLGEWAGVDRLVKFDVYASTDRVYVFVEDRPAGCAVLPAGRFPPGSVNVVFGMAAYHIEVDEFVTRPPARDGFWSRYSTNHSERKFDDLGITSGEQLPAWPDTLPCGTRFYGAAEQ